MRKPYAIWTIKGEDYKLVLTTSAVTELEEKLKGNLLGLVQTGIPPLRMVLTVVHSAMKKHNKKSYSDVETLFDDYIEDGGSQTEFFATTFMEIYQVSGFFSETLTDQMDEKLEEVKDKI